MFKNSKPYLLATILIGMGSLIYLEVWMQSTIPLTCWG